MGGGFMRAEPETKRTVAFIDGRNLYPEVRTISREQDRWIKAASAFPVSLVARNTRGTDRTDWIRIDKATYDASIDRRDYRVKSEDEGASAP